MKMSLRAWVGVVVGFVVGFVISQYFAGGATSEVLLTMQTICAFAGAGAGALVGIASKNGRKKEAVMFAAGGAGVCILIGVAIWIYRWLIG